MIRFRWRFKIPRYWVGIYFKLALKKREGVVVRGVTNKVGHRYVVFLDYDYDEPHSIEGEVRSLQEEWGLGNAYLFKTNKGYHVIFLDLLSYGEFKEILNASSCDDAYKQVPQQNNARAWVLRLTDKKNNIITYQKTIHSKQERMISEPHARLLIMRGVPREHVAEAEDYEEGHEHGLTFAEYEA